MPMALEDLTKAAMDLSPRQRIALAGFLLETADSGNDSDAEIAWESEIQDRIKAIDEGREEGISYEDVKLEIQKRLSA